MKRIALAHCFLSSFPVAVAGSNCSTVASNLLANNTCIFIIIITVLVILYVLVFVDFKDYVQSFLEIKRQFALSGILRVPSVKRENDGHF